MCKTFQVRWADCGASDGSCERKKMMQTTQTREVQCGDLGNKLGWR